VITSLFRAIVALAVFVAVVPAAAKRLQLGHGYPGVRLLAMPDGDVVTIVSNRTATVMTKRSVDLGAVRWEREIEGGVGRIGVDGGGDMVIARRPVVDGCKGLVVVGLAAGDGSERWRVEPAGLAGCDWDAVQLAVAPGGDVFLVGRMRVDGTPPGASTLVVALEPATGRERWRTTGPWLAPTDDDSVAVDPGGDLVFTGSEFGIFQSRTVVVKLTHAGGAEQWRRTLGGLPARMALAFGPNARVVLGLQQRSEDATAIFGVAQLAGDDGRVLWTASVARGVARTLLVDDGGDVFAGGWLVPDGGTVAFSVVRFSGVDGRVSWTRSIATPEPSGGNTVQALAFDTDGSVLAAGRVRDSRNCDDVVTVALDPESGEIRGRQTLDGTAQASACEDDSPCEEIPGECDEEGDPRAGIDNDALEGAVLASDGGLVAAVSLDMAATPTRRVVTLLRLRDRLRGDLLRVRRGKRGTRLLVTTADPDVLAPAPRSDGDPSKHGAVLTLVDLDGGGEQQLILARGGWRTTRGGLRGPSYTFEGGGRGCRALEVVSGRRLVIRCKLAAGDPLASIGPDARLAVRLTLGAATPYCLEFGGNRTVDARGFEARDALAPSSCR